MDNVQNSPVSYESTEGGHRDNIIGMTEIINRKNPTPRYDPCSTPQDHYLAINGSVDSM